MIVTHLADSHLMDSQYGRFFRSDDFINGLLSAIHCGLQAGSEVFIHSGDIINSTRPSPGIMRQLRKVDRFLKANNAYLLLITGNHDATDPHWTSVSLSPDESLDVEIKPDPVTGVSEVKYGINLIDNKLVSIDGLLIYGLPFMSKDKFLSAVGTIPQADILMLHVAVQEFVPFKSDSNITIDELPTERFRIIALGDIHISKYIKADDCWVGYPGSTELCSASEDENKTVTLFDIKPRKYGNKTTVDFLTVVFPTRKVLRYVLNTEPEVALALLDVQSHKDEGPIVIIKYAPHLKDVIARFILRIDVKKSIIIDSPLFARALAGEDPVNAEAALTPVDFLSKFIPGGTELFDLGVAIIEDRISVTVGVSTYANNYLTKAQCGK